MNTSKAATVIAVAALLSVASPIRAQEMEELDESEANRIAELFRNPVKINTATQSRLEECGLFSHYQVQSIIDYRKTKGDILSEAELASLDGFNSRAVSAMTGMLDFGTIAAPGRSSTKTRVRAEIYAGGQIKAKSDEDIRIGYSAKTKVEIGNSLAVNAGIRDGGWSASGSWYGPGHLEKVIVGDFNARFGQGLALWSGFSLSGLNSVSAFTRKATGLSGCSSYNGNYSIRGIAVQCRWNDFVLNGFGTLNGLYGSNLSYRKKSLDIGVTGCWSKDYSKIGCDFRYSVKGLDFWGEGVYDFTAGKFAGISGCQWNIDYRKALILLLRYYPAGLTSAYSGAARASSKASGEAAVSLGASFGEFSSTLDAAALAGKYVQFKNVSVWAFRSGPYFSTRLRAATRVRPDTSLLFRTDIRADEMFAMGRWRTNARAEYVRCRGNAFLAYAETAFATDRLTIWLRTTGFIIDNWDDRIYVYERDVPGTFSSPACYGRGLGGDLYMTWKIGKHSSLYWRVAGQYLFNRQIWSINSRIQYLLKI